MKNNRITKASFLILIHISAFQGNSIYTYLINRFSIIRANTSSIKRDLKISVYSLITTRSKSIIGTIVQTISQS